MVESDLECPIHQSRFDLYQHIPMKPPCSHVICEECLNSYINTKCPICQVATQKNQYVRDQHKIEILKSYDVKCFTEHPQPVQAEWFYENSGLALCQQCADKIQEENKKEIVECGLFWLGSNIAPKVVEFGQTNLSEELQRLYRSMQSRPMSLQEYIQAYQKIITYIQSSSGPFCTRHNISATFVQKILSLSYACQQCQIQNVIPIQNTIEIVEYVRSKLMDSSDLKKHDVTLLQVQMLNNPQNFQIKDLIEQFRVILKKDRKDQLYSFCLQCTNEYTQTNPPIKIKCGEHTLCKNCFELQKNMGRIYCPIEGVYIQYSPAMQAIELNQQEIACQAQKEEQERINTKQNIPLLLTCGHVVCGKCIRSITICNVCQIPNSQFDVSAQFYTEIASLTQLLCLRHENNAIGFHQGNFELVCQDCPDTINENVELISSPDALDNLINEKLQNSQHLILQDQEKLQHMNTISNMEKFELYKKLCQNIGEDFEGAELPICQLMYYADLFYSLYPFPGAAKNQEVTWRATNQPLPVAISVMTSEQVNLYGISIGAAISGYAQVNQASIIIGDTIDQNVQSTILFQGPQSLNTEAGYTLVDVVFQQAAILQEGFWYTIILDIQFTDLYSGNISAKIDNPVGSDFVLFDVKQPNGNCMNEVVERGPIIRILYFHQSSS